MPRLESSGGAAGIIQKLTIFYIVVWSISPPLQIDTIYRLAALGCAGIWAVMSLRRGLFVYKIHIYAVMFAVAVAFIAYMEKGSFDAILSQIGIYIMVVCFLINAFYEEDKWQELSLIIPVVLILVIVFNWRTAQILLEDHTIARLLVRDDAEVYQYMRQGIGGYSLIYPQVCISPAILAWTLKAFKHHKIYFAIGCIWVYTYILCIIRAGYSIAIFASIIGVMILLIYKRKSSVLAVIMAFLLFIAGILLIMYSDGVRGYLLETFDGTAVADKINDLMGTSENEGANSIEDRMVAYSYSIKTILQYPFIGGLWMGGGGGHSAILDIIAKYGLLGGYVFVVMLFYVPHYYKRTVSHSSIVKMSNAVIVTIMFVALLDSFNYSFMPMILVVLPLLFEDILRWEGIENENSLGGESDSRGAIEKTEY